MSLTGELLARHPVAILDGATGTEILRRGFRTDLPLGPARAITGAPDLLRTIHENYIAAGADVITANTSRTSAWNLEKAGMADRSSELTREAVRIALGARDGAAAGRKILVAGSMVPLEGWHHPELVPSAKMLGIHHRQMSGTLADSGVDLILVESMSTMVEAQAATLAARETGSPVWTALSCGPHGRLRSGEPIASVVQALASLGPEALLINCTNPALVPDGLAGLARAPVPAGAYPNIGSPDDEVGWAFDREIDPLEFGVLAKSWVAAGARIVGGCCGTTPEHLWAMSASLRAAPESGGT